MVWVCVLVLGFSLPVVCLFCVIDFHSSCVGECVAFFFLVRFDNLFFPDPSLTMLFRDHLQGKTNFWIGFFLFLVMSD